MELVATADNKRSEANRYLNRSMSHWLKTKENTQAQPDEITEEKSDESKKPSIAIAMAIAKKAKTHATVTGVNRSKTAPKINERISKISETLGYMTKKLDGLKNSEINHTERLEELSDILSYYLDGSEEAMMEKPQSDMKQIQDAHIKAFDI